MNLLRFYLRREIEEMKRNGIRLHVIGDAPGLPPDIRAMVEEAEARTRDNRRLTVVDRAQLRQPAGDRRGGAADRARGEGGAGRPRGEVDETLFAEQLETARHPGSRPPDPHQRRAADQQLPALAARLHRAGLRPGGLARLRRRAPAGGAARVPRAASGAMALPLASARDPALPQRVVAGLVLGAAAVLLVVGRRLAVRRAAAGRGRPDGRGVGAPRRDGRPAASRSPRPPCRSWPSCWPRPAMPRGALWLLLLGCVAAAGDRGAGAGSAGQPRRRRRPLSRPAGPGAGLAARRRAGAGRPVAAARRLGDRHLRLLRRTRASAARASHRGSAPARPGRGSAAGWRGRPSSAASLALGHARSGLAAGALAALLAAVAQAGDLFEILAQAARGREGQRPPHPRPRRRCSTGSTASCSPRPPSRPASCLAGACDDGCSRRRAPRSVTLLGATGSIGRSTLALIARGARALPGRGGHGRSRSVAALAARRARDAGAARGDRRPVRLRRAEGRPRRHGHRAGGRARGAGRGGGAPGRVGDGGDRRGGRPGAGAGGASGAGPCVALANKECLVCAGALFMREVRGGRALLLPVNSEHNAIFQALGRQRPGRGRAADPHRLGRAVPQRVARATMARATPERGGARTRTGRWAPRSASTAPR